MIDLTKKTAFIIGNGASRAKFDLTTLSPHGTTYGCNALYRDFYPDWLVSIDDAEHHTLDSPAAIAAMSSRLRRKSRGIRAAAA